MEMDTTIHGTLLDLTIDLSVDITISIHTDITLDIPFGSSFHPNFLIKGLCQNFIAINNQIGLCSNIVNN